VYTLPCLVLYQLRPGQSGFVQINHTIDERNAKIVLEICDGCRRKEEMRWRLKDKLTIFSRLISAKPSKHPPCKICQNYEPEDDQPLKVIPLF
jgi:hypothetical protein